MDDQTSNILELAFLMCLMVIIAMLSVNDVFYVKAHLSKNTSLEDKTSGLEYSTLIDKALLEQEDLEAQVLAIVLASDTDKMANVRVDIYLDGALSTRYEIVGNQLDNIVTDLYTRVGEVTGITDRANYAFEIAVGLSETTISIYVTS